VSKLGDGGDEEQVIEQLQPAQTPVFLIDVEARAVPYLSSRQYSNPMI
jgi:hypothetical protein